MEFSLGDWTSSFFGLGKYCSVAILVVASTAPVVFHTTSISSLGYSSIILIVRCSAPTVTIGQDASRQVQTSKTSHEQMGKFLMSKRNLPVSHRAACWLYDFHDFSSPFSVAFPTAPMHLLNIIIIIIITAQARRQTVDIAISVARITADTFYQYTRRHDCTLGLVG